MISFKINRVPTLFIKGFTAQDGETIVDFVERQASRSRDRVGDGDGRDNTVLFIDTPVTSATVQAIRRLKEGGSRVVFRDHHGLEAEPSSERERQVEALGAALHKLLGSDCLITKRSLHPACSSLVKVGEFSSALAVVADPDPDGLTAAMKALGVHYLQLDEDASLLDGEPALQVTGSPLSALLAKGMATLPSYDPGRPGERERALELLFTRWVAAVQGDVKALATLEAGVEIYDRAVSVARHLASTASEVAPGVVLVNTVKNPLYDPGTLIALMEERPGCKVTVIRKDKGPIAAHHGVQYSLAVARAYQGELNLQNLVPPESTSDPRLGLISNVSFLLHVCEVNWKEQVLPALSRTLVLALLLALLLSFRAPALAQGNIGQVPGQIPAQSSDPGQPALSGRGAGYNIAPAPVVAPAAVNSGVYAAPMTARVSATEAPAILPLGMLVSTTYHIEGFRIKEYKGIVRGVMVREPTIGQNFKAGFQGMFGGHVGAYMQMCEQGRRQSYENMIQNAQSMGANAIVGISYDSNSFAVGPDQFATEVVCYGTAVVLEPQR